MIHHVAPRVHVFPTKRNVVVDLTIPRAKRLHERRRLTTDSFYRNVTLCDTSTVTFVYLFAEL